MIVFQHLDDVFILTHQRFFGGQIVNRSCFGLRLRHLPFAAVIIQHQINHPEVIPPHARHDSRYTVQRSFGNISPFNAGEIFAREHCVRVAEENGINAFHFAEVVDGVFRHRLIRIGRQTRVRHDDHQIGAFLTHLRHILTCSFRNVIDRHFAAQVGLIPGHDLRRYKTDITNLQGLCFPVLIDHGRLFDQIRSEQRLIGLNVDDIGVNVREFGSGERHV